MTFPLESRHAVGIGRQDPTRERAFLVGDRTVLLQLCPMWNADGAPRWWIWWLPAPPERMPSEVIEQFDAEIGKAKASILATWQELQCL